MRKIFAFILALSGSCLCCYAQNIIECITTHTDSNGKVEKYVSKYSFEKEGDISRVTEYGYNRFGKEELISIYESRLIVHKNTTDSIVEGVMYDHYGEGKVNVHTTIVTYTFDNKTHLLISKTTYYPDTIHPVYPPKTIELRYYDKHDRTKKIVQGHYVGKRIEKTMIDLVSYQNNMAVQKHYTRINYKNRNSRKPVKYLIPRKEFDMESIKTFDENGRVIREENRYPQETQLFKNQYDERGNPLKEECYILINLTEQFLCSDEYEYKYE